MIEGAVTPALTDHYYKARKQYLLFSGLLLAWTLIGIQFVGERPEEPLAIKIGVVENVKITLSSPGIVPSIFAILIVYFAYRLSIEWYQCDTRRRLVGVAKADFIIAHFLGFLSVGLFVAQKTLAINYGKIAEEGIPAILSIPLLFVAWNATKSFFARFNREFVRNDYNRPLRQRVMLGLTSALPILFFIGVLGASMLLILKGDTKGVLVLVVLVLVVLVDVLIPDTFSQRIRKVFDPLTRRESDLEKKLSTNSPRDTEPANQKE
jgi:hypothetical protein